MIYPVSFKVSENPGLVQVGPADDLLDVKLNCCIKGNQLCVGVKLEASQLQSEQLPSHHRFSRSIRISWIL